MHTLSKTDGRPRMKQFARKGTGGHVADSSVTVVREHTYSDTDIMIQHLPRDIDLTQSMQINCSILSHRTSSLWSFLWVLDLFGSPRIHCRRFLTWGLVDDHSKYL